MIRFIFIVCCVGLLSSCKERTTVDIVQYSASGSVIAEYKNVYLEGGRSGYIKFKTSTGTQILIDGPHKIEYR